MRYRAIKNKPDLTLLFPSIQMCNQLFKYRINQTAPAGDKDVTERTDSDSSKPIIRLTSAEGDVVSAVSCSCQWSHMLVWYQLPSQYLVISWTRLPSFFRRFQSSVAYLLLRLFVSICLHSAALTLCLLTFASCLSAHLSSTLSSYLPSCLSDSNLLSVSAPSNHTPPHSHMPSLNLHLFSTGDEATRRSPAIVNAVYICVYVCVCVCVFVCVCVYAGVYLLLINPLHPVQPPQEWLCAELDPWAPVC